MINQETNNDQLAGAFKALIEAVKKNIDKCLPCQVVEISKDRTRVKVQPLIKVVGSSGEMVSRAEISGLPVFTLGAGDAFISFPISVGDFGWIEASDRDISLFLQDYKDSEPPTSRKHSFSDARFIPDIMKDFTINAEDSSALVVSTRDASHKIAIDSDGIRFTSSEDIKANDATITSDGDVITSDGVSLRDFKAEYDLHLHQSGLLVDGGGASVTGVTGVIV